MVFLLGIAMILKITWFCKIPQELVPDVKRLFFLVLLRYIMVVMRTAFETAAFIADRIDITERLQSGAYLLQAGILLFVCLTGSRTYGMWDWHLCQRRCFYCWQM